MDACLGAALQPSQRCFRHSNDAERNQHIAECLKIGNFINLRGNVVTVEVVQFIRQSSIVIGQTFLGSISLLGADIRARLEFQGFTFEGLLELSGASITEALSFNDCKFKKEVIARFTFFNNGAPSVNLCEFARNVDVSYAHAEEVSVWFEACMFQGKFDATGIAAALLLNKSIFNSDVILAGSESAHIGLEGATVSGKLDVVGSKFRSFLASRLFAGSVDRMGPFTADGGCKLDGAKFDRLIHIDIKTGNLVLSGSHYESGGTITVDGARVELDGVSAGGPLQINGRTGHTTNSSIVSIQNSDAGSMRFAHIDMTRCVFYGAHNLKEIVIEPTVELSRSSKRASRRRCVADEFAWRAWQGGWVSWFWKLPGTRLAGKDPLPRDGRNYVDLPHLRASQVANVYRSLRQSFEAASDQPGAADFYYGEMEMRRYSNEAGVAERMILTVYWFVAGYGLRAWRAFATLTAVVLVAGWALSITGFSDPMSFAGSVLYAARSMIPGLRPPVPTTLIGGWVQVGLSIVGPILLSLTILALRNRVRR